MKMTKLAFMTLLWLGVQFMVAYAQEDTLQQTGLDRFMKERGFISIPLTKNKPGHLIIEVVINGKKGVFILDTGAGGSVVDSSKASFFSLDQIADSGSIGAGAGGSGLSVQMSFRNSLEVGNWTVREQPISIMNLDHVNTTFIAMKEEPVAGVLGADILTLGRAVIDYPNLLLYLKPIVVEPK